MIFFKLHSDIEDAYASKIAIIMCSFETHKHLNQYKNFRNKNVIGLIDGNLIKYQLSQYNKYHTWKKNRNMLIKEERKNCRRERRKIIYPKVSGKPKIKHLIPEETLILQKGVAEILKWSFEENQIFGEFNTVTQEQYMFVSQWKKEQILNTIF